MESTLSRAQCMPLPFSRPSTTSLLPLSTIPVQLHIVAEVDALLPPFAQEAGNLVAPFAERPRVGARR